MMRSSRRKSAMPSAGTTEAFQSNKRKKTVGSSLLSDDMMIEVLLRLPVKPIIRFRAVCRAWAALLSSKEFCSLHMAINKAAPAQLKLLHVSHTSRFDSSAVYSCSPSGHKDDLLFTLDHARRHSSVEVLTPAPCRGLTLLHDPASLAYCICNASTRAVTRLPPYRKVVHFSTAGLGFDSRTREYKVVRLFNDMGTAKCDVYTLGRRRPLEAGRRRNTLQAVKSCKFCCAECGGARVTTCVGKRVPALVGRSAHSNYEAKNWHHIIFRHG